MNTLTKRIIPCLDIKDGKTVKGINFKELREAGDPVELAAYYSENGADELVFLDITATLENRKTFAQLVEKIARRINIPFTVGGGIRQIEDVDILLQAGADKVSVNSAAVKRPDLINELSAKFGSQCIVVAIDAKETNKQWKVYLAGGTIPTELELFTWAKEVENRGAGEILFTSMNHDGTKNGYAIEALDILSKTVNIPVIASGGAGKKMDFEILFRETNVDAALAASIFHFNEVPIPLLKIFLKTQLIQVR